MVKFSVSLRRASNKELLEAFEFYAAFVKGSTLNTGKSKRAVVKLAIISLNIIENEIYRRNVDVWAQREIINTSLNKHFKILEDKGIEKFKEVLKKVSDEYHKENNININ